MPHTHDAGIQTRTRYRQPEGQKIKRPIAHFCTPYEKIISGVRRRGDIRKRQKPTDVIKENKKPGRIGAETPWKKVKRVLSGKRWVDRMEKAL